MKRSISNFILLISIVFPLFVMANPPQPQVPREAFQGFYREITYDIQCKSGSCSPGVCLSMANFLKSEINKRNLTTNFDPKLHCEFDGAAQSYAQQLVNPHVQYINVVIPAIAQVLKDNLQQISNTSHIVNRLQQRTASIPFPGYQSTPTPSPAAPTNNQTANRRSIDSRVIEYPFSRVIRELECTGDGCPQGLCSAAVEVFRNEIRNQGLTTNISAQNLCHSSASGQQTVNLQSRLKTGHYQYLTESAKAFARILREISGNNQIAIYDYDYAFENRVSSVLEQLHTRHVLSNTPAASDLNFLNQIQRIQGQSQANINRLISLSRGYSDLITRRSASARGCVNSPNTNPNFSCLNDQERYGITYYTGSGYREINQALRINQIIPQTRTMISQIQSGMRKLRPFRGVVFRGINTQQPFANVQAGGTLRDSGFLSTSTSPKTAMEFARSYSGTLLILSSKTCVSVDDISASRGEGEVICHPGTRFQITHRISQEGTLYILADEI